MYSQNELLKIAFRIVNPWRKTMKTEYSRGWNDCLKEIKKREKSFLKAHADWEKTAKELVEK